jgi:hypothetical protein
MALESTTNVETISSVADVDGNAVPAASDAHGTAHGVDVDITGAGASESPPVPGRPTQLTILVEATAAFEVTVQYQYPDGNDLPLTRTYTGGVGSPVYQVVAVAFPHFEVRITDTSGGANTATYAMTVV